MSSPLLGRPIVPAQFDGLREITWDRDPQRPTSASDAFAICESNWRFLDQGALSPAERELIEALAHASGHGVTLV